MLQDTTLLRLKAHVKALHTRNNDLEDLLVRALPIVERCRYHDYQCDQLGSFLDESQAVMDSILLSTGILDPEDIDPTRTEGEPI